MKSVQLEKAKKIVSIIIVPLVCSMGHSAPLFAGAPQEAETYSDTCNTSETLAPNTRCTTVVLYKCASIAEDRPEYDFCQSYNPTFKYSDCLHTITRERGYIANDIKILSEELTCRTPLAGNWETYVLPKDNYTSLFLQGAW